MTWYNIRQNDFAVTDYECFSLLEQFLFECHTIGLKISHRFLIHSEVRPKLIVSLLWAFSSRFTLSFDWFIGLSVSLWLTKVITLVLVLQHSLKKLLEVATG